MIDSVFATTTWMWWLQVDAFAEGLHVHQRAMTADGSTVLERAMIEHNLAAASKLYMNIYSEELGQLLGTSAERAERVAARMIAEERLQVVSSWCLESYTVCSYHVLLQKLAEKKFPGLNAVALIGSCHGQVCQPMLMAPHLLLAIIVSMQI